MTPCCKKHISQFKQNILFFFLSSDARDSSMMRKFVGLEDPEDRVFGAFVMGKVLSHILVILVSLFSALSVLFFKLLFLIFLESYLLKLY